MLKHCLREEKSPVKKALLFFFFPPRCASCRKRGHGPLCEACREELEEAFDPCSFRTAGGIGFADEMLSLFSYQTEALQPMLFQWKHHPTDTLTEIMAQYLRRGWQKGLFPADLDGICFCPRSRFARHREGFDQAELLAQLLSQITGIPFIPLLERRGFSLPQHKRKARQRERNVKNAFSPLRPLAGDHILLVDDIVTTGATAREAARVLKKAGAMRVTVFSLAH